MRLTLTLTAGGSSLPDKDRKRFLASSGPQTSLSIGRNADNDWVLPSPDRSISRTHCSIACEGGQFVLTDLSTNGLFVNSARTDRDTRVILNAGDELTLGNYVISLAILDDQSLGETDAAGLGNVRGGRGPLDIDPLADPPPRQADAFQQLPRMVTGRRGADPFEAVDRKPANALDLNKDPFEDRFNGVRPSADWQGLPTPDHAAAISQAIPPPRMAASRKVDFDALIGDVPGGAPPAAAPDPFAPAQYAPAQSPAPPPVVAPRAGRVDPFAHLDDDLSPAAPAQVAQMPPAAAPIAPPAAPASRVDPFAGLDDLDLSVPSAAPVPPPVAAPVPPPVAPTPPPIAAPMPPQVVTPTPSRASPFAHLDDDLLPVAPVPVAAPPVAALPVAPPPLVEARQATPPAPPPLPPAHEPAPAYAETVIPLAEQTYDPASNPFTEPPVVRPRGAPAAEARPPAVTPRPAAPPPRDGASEPASDGDALRALLAFLEGAGVPAGQIDTSDPAAILRAAGKVFRAMTEGFQQVLKSRAAVKGDMGIEQTIISSSGNNALKFAVTTDDAVRLLLTPKAPGYKDPLASARQAADDIVSHELGVMAGVQEALLSLLHRFDPDELEKRMEKGVLGGLLPAARKARYWDAFRQTYGDLSREAEDEFHNVFGRPFAKAYTTQARRD